MPWRGSGIWTWGTTISRKQTLCIVQSLRMRPNWGHSTYWPSRTTNRRILATVYSETGISWTVLDFLRIPWKQQTIYLRSEVVKIFAIFFFWNFQAKWVLCSCCGMLQEKIIRCESALNSFGNAPVNAVSCFAVEWPGPLRMGLCYVADQSLQVAGGVKPFSLDLKWSRNWRNLMAAEARCQVTPYS